MSTFFVFLWFCVQSQTKVKVKMTFFSSQRDSQRISFDFGLPREIFICLLLFSAQRDWDTKLKLMTKAIMSPYKRIPFNWCHWKTSLSIADKKWMWRARRQKKLNKKLPEWTRQKIKTNFMHFRHSMNSFELSFYLVFNCRTLMRSPVKTAAT